jgi:hypothetical protein
MTSGRGLDLGHNVRRKGDSHALQHHHDRRPFMSELIEEAVDEALGTSSKKWALILIALVVGAALALWLSSRGSSGEPDHRAG